MLIRLYQKIMTAYYGWWADSYDARPFARQTIRVWHKRQLAVAKWRAHRDAAK